MTQITSRNKNIEPGDIFYQNKRFQYIRILLCDKYKICYQNLLFESLEEELKNISYDPKVKGMSHTTLYYFKDLAFPWVGHKPLSEQEYKMLRPDLPISFGRSKLLSWKAISLLSSYQDLFDYEEEFKKEFAINKLYIRTYGPQGGGKKIGEIALDKENNLSIAQIMWQSAQYQAEVFEDDRYGVGIFRTETEKGYPLYSLFGYYGHGTSILGTEFGTGHGTLATLGNRELPSLGWQEYLKKKKIDKTSYKIIVDELKFPIEGTTLELFLEWHRVPVKSFQIPSNEFILDLSEYPPGFYIVLISSSEGGKYTGWYEYHLIRDNFDGWVYIYPDMENITKYSKKIEEPKKLSIPKIRANASMKRYEKKFNELLADEKIKGRGDIMDMEEHGFQLHYFDLNEADSHFDALSEQGFQGGGPTWYGIISGAIQLADPTLNDEIYIDDDSEGIIISSKSKAVLEKMSHLIGILKSEPELLAASIHIAEKNEMID